jgi:O-antigen/teichoic acid export membrane protein
MRSLAKNSVLNSSGMAAGMLVLLVATPVYLKALGLDRFGIFTLIASITGPLNILNAGISQATTKFVAQYSAEGDLKKASQFVQTTFFLNLILGLVGCLILYGAAPVLAIAVFKVPIELRDEAIVAFRLGGLTWLFMQVAATFQAVLIGFQHYQTLALHNPVQSLLTYGVGAALLLFFPSLTAVLLVSLAVNVLYSAFWYLKANELLGRTRLFPAWIREHARHTWNFSGWQMVNTIVTLAANNADRWLIGMLLGTSALGIYGIAMSVQNRLVTLIWSLIAVLFPAASSVSSTTGAAEKLLLKYGWAFSLAGIFLYGTLFIVSNDALSLWLGGLVAQEAAPLLRVLLFVAFLGLPSAVMYQYLLSHGLTKWLSFSNILSTVVTLAASWIMIKAFGLMGAAWGAAAGLVLTRPWFHWWVFKQKFCYGKGTASHFSMLYSLQLSGMLAALAAWLVFQVSATGFERPVLRLLFGTLVAFILLGGGALAMERLFFNHLFHWRQLIAGLRPSLGDRTIQTTTL